MYAEEIRNVKETSQVQGRQFFWKTVHKRHSATSGEKVSRMEEVEGRKAPDTRAERAQYPSQDVDQAEVLVSSHFRH